MPVPVPMQELQWLSDIWEHKSLNKTQKVPIDNDATV